MIKTFMTVTLPGGEPVELVKREDVLALLKEHGVSENQERDPRVDPKVGDIVKSPTGVTWIVSEISADKTHLRFRSKSGCDCGWMSPKEWGDIAKNDEIVYRAP